MFELAFAECPKSYVFRGNKDVTAKQIQQLLGLGGAARPQQTPAAQTPSQITPNRFLRPFSEVTTTTTSSSSSGKDFFSSFLIFFF